MDGRWIAFAVVATLAAAGQAKRGSRSTKAERLDLTSDRPLTLRQARKLKRWWECPDWSVSLRKVHQDRFDVVVTRSRPRGSRSTERNWTDEQWRLSKWLKSSNAMHELATELLEEEGRYGRGEGDYFQFNIKAHGWAPEWVVRHLGEEGASEIIFEQRTSLLEWLIEDLSTQDSPIWQSWYADEWTTRGRQGGWLLLKHRGTPDTLEELADAWPGDGARRGLGGMRFGVDYFAEVVEAVTNGLEEKQGIAKLEVHIKVLTEDFETTWTADDEKSDALWGEMLDLDADEVQALK